MRPAIERYVRASATVGAWTVEPGLEWRDGDDFAALSALLSALAENCAGLLHESMRTAPREAEPVAASRALESAIEHSWPGRAWFVEVHDTAGHWLQCYQPYDIPLDVPRGPHCGCQASACVAAGKCSVTTPGPSHTCPVFPAGHRGAV